MITMRYLIMLVFYDEALSSWVRTCIAESREFEDARSIARACLDRREALKFCYCEILDNFKDDTYTVMKED